MSVRHEKFTSESVGTVSCGLDLHSQPNIDDATLTRRDALRQIASGLVLASLFPACSKDEYSLPESKPTLGPSIPAEQITRLVEALSTAAEQQGDHVFEVVPQNSKALVVVIRYAHHNSAIELPDPEGAGIRLLQDLSSSTARSLDLAIRTLEKQSVYGDGITADAQSYLQSYLTLDEKRRSPETVQNEIDEFHRLRALILRKPDSRNRSEAVKMVNRSIAEWESLLSGIKRFHKEADVNPLQRVMLDRRVNVEVSEDAALLERTLNAILAPIGTPTESSAETFEELLRESVRMSAKDRLDPMELYGSEEVVSLQETREDAILTRALANDATSVILMGAGHRFADNIQRAGLEDAVALVEIHPRALWAMGQN